MSTIEGCLACDLTSGARPLPGGLIHERDGWLVEHCVGPLGLGTLVVKPRRHVTAVVDLDEPEVSALGPILRDASDVASALTDPDQVYHCLWSHAGGAPVHVHYVVQPVTRSQLEEFGAHGPRLQAAMFDADVHPAIEEIEQVSDRARELFDALR